MHAKNHKLYSHIVLCYYSFINILLRVKNLAFLLMQDLTKLSQLPCLESLSLKDPVYGPNPVALLCNYSTHLLYHLPNLRRVDSYSVENKMLKDLAEVWKEFESRKVERKERILPRLSLSVIFWLGFSVINICYLPGGRSVWEKTVPEVLSTALGLRPRAVLKTKGTVFSHTDRPSPVNNIFIFFLQ